ncbi:hypothetical protein [Microbacterium sp. zg-YB36]|uniref:hypothetical protein n=1 Tax=Microbacterium sp. zg-YB36 TaxID=2969407 RepID=UPI00214CCBAA|nr:hypothetical protein [Microbacterium sp. zg-YB36]MDL5352175.1 hypothetical protein [Microbacterium sp. zg-YB36]
MGMDAVDTVPKLLDHRGYQVTKGDLDFLGIPIESVRAVTEGQYPLGMSADLYLRFVHGLFAALEREGVNDADVRIQGSSVRFFSGEHKAMVYSRASIYQAYLDSRGAEAPNPTLDSIHETVAKQWPEGQPRPEARPFDVMYVLGIDGCPSDYDVQVSSNALIKLIRKSIRENFSIAEADEKDLRVSNRSYNFVEKVYVANHLLYLSAWAERASRDLGRSVTLALFSSSGPPDTRESTGGLSSHFRDDEDWILQTPKGN